MEAASSEDEAPADDDDDDYYALLKVQREEAATSADSNVESFLPEKVFTRRFNTIAEAKSRARAKLEKKFSSRNTQNKPVQCQNDSQQQLTF